MSAVYWIRDAADSLKRDVCNKMLHCACAGLTHSTIDVKNVPEKKIKTR